MEVLKLIMPPSLTVGGANVFNRSENLLFYKGFKSQKLTFIIN